MRKQLTSGIFTGDTDYISAKYVLLEGELEVAPPKEGKYKEEKDENENEDVVNVKFDAAFLKRTIPILYYTIINERPTGSSNNCYVILFDFFTNIEGIIDKNPDATPAQKKIQIEIFKILRSLLAFLIGTKITNYEENKQLLDACKIIFSKCNITTTIPNWVEAIEKIFAVFREIYPRSLITAAMENNMEDLKYNKNTLNFLAQILQNNVITNKQNMLRLPVPSKNVNCNDIVVLVKKF